MLNWLRNNIAYDVYIEDREARSYEAEDWSGKYSAWNLKTGVCWDFSNIYAIMCRAQGIPCTTVGCESQNHVWNLVMINGRWIEADITTYARYETPEKKMRRYAGNTQKRIPDSVISLSATSRTAK